MSVFEKAPAKINLSLDVLGKRDDGYHDVEMIMTTIDLYDRIELDTLKEDKIKVSIWSRYVPNDERNLAYKAAAALKKKYSIPQGVHIRIEKNIPVSAGLGGGSSDAAAVLRGLNKLWSLNLPLEELATIGATIGSDIPFCVYGKTAIEKGRGEIIERLPSPPTCWVVLAKPDIGVSSRNIFKKYIHKERPHSTQKVINSLERNQFLNLCRTINNVLEEVTFELYPEVEQMKSKMIKYGATGVLMSGSGPTIYGLVKQHGKAKRIYNGMRGFCDEVYVVRLLG